MNYFVATETYISFYSIGQTVDRMLKSMPEGAEYVDLKVFPDRNPDYVVVTVIYKTK